MEHKRILHVDLNEKTALFKISGDLHETVGGVVTAYSLMFEYIEENPLIITTGPLSGYFPFVSKTCLLYKDGNNVIEKYGGGSIGPKMNYANLDAIVITGINRDVSIKVDIHENNTNFSEYEPNSKNEVSHVADLMFSKKKVISKGYFSFGEINLTDRFSESSKILLNIDHTISKAISNAYDYEKLYDKILDMYKELTVEPGNNPSCVGCPMGCDLSLIGEDDLNVSVLARSLIGCGYASAIFKQIPIAFACLQSVGYYYSHGDLEKLPSLLTKTKEKISMKLK